MPDSKISNLTELTAPVAEDELVIVDKSDTTMAASGTTKKITKANLVPQITPASSSAPASLDLHEDTDNGTNKITVTAPSAVASDKVLTLPDATDTLVGKDTTDTLTNKTLTSPVIQDWDGWQVANETWTYSSATTFTVPTDLTAKYTKGTKIKCTNSTVKYFYVVSSNYAAPNTTVTVTGETDLANSAITDPYCSYADCPRGFKKGELFYKARVVSSGTQPIPAAAFTVIALNTRSYDINSNFDTSTYRYTAPIAGFYSIKFQGRLNFSTDTLTDFLLAIYKNGSNYSYGQRRADSTVGAGLQYGLIDDTVYLNKGDYIDFRIYQGSGGNKNTEAGACCNIRFTGV